MSQSKLLEFDDFPKICCICLYKGNLKPFTKPLQNIISSLYTFTLSEYDSELPKNICSKCSQKLKEIKAFIDLAVISREHLINIISEHKNQEHLEDLEKDAKFIISGESTNDDIKDEDFDNGSDCGDANNDSEETTYIKNEESEEIENYQYHCKCCKNIFISIEDLNDHLKQNKDCVLKCETCNQTFESYQLLNGHKLNNASCTLRKFKCDACGKSFKEKVALKRHMTSHTDETPYPCKLCGKKFKFPQNLRRHDNIVHKELKPFKCDICGKELNSSQMHNDCNNSKNSIQNYVCPICKPESLKKQDFLNSVNKHNGRNKCNKASEGKLSCNFCDKTFTTKPNLRKHLLYHGEKRHLCITCGKTFYLKQQLDEHFLLHTGGKPHKCKQCGKAFRLYNYYKAHELTHTGKRPYSCQICKRSFMQKSHLTRHLNIHSGKKPFSCNVCSKRFSSKSYLTVHNKIHTGETTHICPVCDKGFYDSSNLKRHVATHAEMKR